MIAKFPDFDAYQLGKYNKERSIKRKIKKIKEEKSKGNKSAKMPEKPMITLKQMIRILHINQPHLQVMCLLGKKYPLTESEFAVSGLYGKFEPGKLSFFGLGLSCFLFYRKSWPSNEVTYSRDLGDFVI